MSFAKLTELKDWLTAHSPSILDEQERAHRLFAAAQISKFEQQPAQALKSTEPLAPPPGAPIGELGSGDDDLEY
jgi:hypothetical protein